MDASNTTYLVLDPVFSLAAWWLIIAAQSFVVSCTVWFLSRATTGGSIIANNQKS